MSATFGTIVNPTRKLAEYVSLHASNKLAQAVVAVATPAYASQLKGLASHFPNLQTVAIASDTVPLGCQRSGFSWLVSERPLTVKDAMPLLKDTTSRNWQESAAAVRFTSSADPLFDIGVPAANTLFSTGQIAEIYAGGDALQALHVELPLTLKPKISIRPVQPISEQLEITAAADNMLKTLNGERAATFLERAAELQTLHEPAVFAELSSGEMIKVVAGGGGLWSPRASMLVLEPPAAPRVGEHLRFWLGQGVLDDTLESQLASTPPNGLILETAHVPQTVAEEKPLLEYKKNHFLPVFGLGSERGFFVGDHKHSIVYESLYFS